MNSTSEHHVPFTTIVFFLPQAAGGLPTTAAHNLIAGGILFCPHLVKKSQLYIPDFLLCDALFKVFRTFQTKQNKAKQI